MFRKMIAAVGLACALSLTAPLSIAAQQTTTTSAGQDADKAGQEVENRSQLQ